MNPILVIGATGTVGGEVVKALLGRGEPVRVLVRSKWNGPKSVEVARGDLTDVGSLRAAMTGARGAFFVTANGADEVLHGGNVIRVAEELRLVRLVYSAAYRYWSPNRFFDALLEQVTAWLGPHYRGKLKVSRRLLRSSVSHVVLRPTNFFQNDVLVRGPLLEGVYVQPLGRKAVDRVDVRDIADAAVRAFTPGLVADGAWPVVGPRALTGVECAEAWSRALGRPVRYEDDLPRWSELVRAPLGEAALGDWTKTFKLIQRHGFVTSPRELALTRKLLGREPRSYEAWALEQAGQLAAKPRAA